MTSIRACERPRAGSMLAFFCAAFLVQLSIGNADAQVCPTDPDKSCQGEGGACSPPAGGKCVNRLLGTAFAASYVCRCETAESFSVHKDGVAGPVQPIKPDPETPPTTSTTPPTGTNTQPGTPPTTGGTPATGTPGTPVVPVKPPVVVTQHQCRTPSLAIASGYVFGNAISAVAARALEQAKSEAETRADRAARPESAKHSCAAPCRKYERVASDWWKPQVQPFAAPPLEYSVTILDTWTLYIACL